ncbi:hypothetical protein B0H17DRAFT_1177568 [Mycena rosella]|uniref:DUF6534 domain-containing protein n=1 Tax=Mycena rosella TaxID=1033263 RepID=A0AAD7DRU2_MYCRO|nr:hypothetical protein B0H17DRAFT_1177568 [Mycena rosella]
MATVHNTQVLFSQTLYNDSLNILDFQVWSPVRRGRHFFSALWGYVLVLHVREQINMEVKLELCRDGSIIKSTFAEIQRQLSFWTLALMPVQGGARSLMRHMPTCAPVRTFIIEIYPTALLALMVRNFYAYRIYRLNFGPFFPSVEAQLDARRICLTSQPRILCFPPLLYEHSVNTTNVESDRTEVPILACGSKLLTNFWELRRFQSQWTLLGPESMPSFPTEGRYTNQHICGSFRDITFLTQAAASPDTMVYIFFFLLLSSLYTNSLLVTLNARDYMRSRGNDEAIYMDSGFGFRRTDIISPAGRVLSSESPIAIRIDKRTERESDEKYVDKWKRTIAFWMEYRYAMLLNAPKLAGVWTPPNGSLPQDFPHYIRPSGHLSLIVQLSAHQSNPIRIIPSCLPIRSDHLPTSYKPRTTNSESFGLRSQL